VRGVVERPPNEYAEDSDYEITNDTMTQARAGYERRDDSSFTLRVRRRSRVDLGRELMGSLLEIVSGL